MRRRGSTEGVRQSLAAWYWDLSKLYDERPQGPFELLARALDAGEPVVLHAYEVDGAGSHGLVRVDRDGSVVPVAWNHALRDCEVLS